MTLGEKLQMLRSHAGMSQEELAERLNVSRQAISKWELNKTVPEVKYIVSISGIFGVTTDILLKEGTDAAESAGNSKGQTASPDSHREQPEILTDRAAGLPDTGAGKCSGGYAAGDVVALRLSGAATALLTFHIELLGFQEVLEDTLFDGGPKRALMVMLICLEPGGRILFGDCSGRLLDPKASGIKKRCAVRHSVSLRFTGS